MDYDIRIEKAVLHILDNNISLPVLSNSQLEIEDEISEFLTKHLIKILNDNNLKSACFTNDNNRVIAFCRELRDNSDNFLNVSYEIVNSIFQIMLKNIDIAPADLICCLFQCNGVNNLGIIKLNYKTGFTHYVSQADEGSSNTLIKYQTLLPSDTQKVDECVILDLNDFGIKLIENEYEINGQKDYYLSKIFLNCDTDLSNNEKLKIINKATEKINKKYFEEDFEKVAKFKKSIAESLEESSVVSVNAMAEKVFEKNIEIQKEYVEEVQKAGLLDNDIYIPEEIAAKKFKTHKIKTDTGIEINFPLELFEDKRQLEFINNPEGTISILIKNITKITNR